jgi:hypothetical protein
MLTINRKKIAGWIMLVTSMSFVIALSIESEIFRMIVLALVLAFVIPILLFLLCAFVFHVVSLITSE